MALKGNIQVNVFELEKFRGNIKSFQACGGIEVTDNSKTIPGKTGFAQLNKVSANPGEIIEEANVIMVAVPAIHHEYFLKLSPLV